MRPRSSFSMGVVTAVVAGCTFSNLASYEIAGEGEGGTPSDGVTGQNEGGAGEGEGGAASCPGAAGPIAVGASEPCSETPDGTAIVYPLKDDPRGACKRGTKTCTGTGKFDKCVGATGPSARDCTSTNDNDCNGVPDASECKGCTKADTTEGKLGDAVSCFDFPPPAQPVGPCSAGTKTCKASADKKSLVWGSCVGAVGPTATKDTCGGTSDENCNGVPHDECPCVTGETRLCGDCSRTVQVCSAAGTFPACPTSSSNTYNGVTVGGACSGGTGACYRSGTVVCPAGGGNATCSSLPAPPGSRNCTSSADNDCNGVADNAEGICRCDGTAPIGSGGSCGANACGAGSRTCNSAGASAAWSGCGGIPNVPGNLGATCGCRGSIQCSGVCSNSRPGPAVSEAYVTQENFSCCFINYNKRFGGSCTAGSTYYDCYTERLSGGGSCDVVAGGGGGDCGCTVNFHNNGTDGAQCRVHIRQYGCN